MAKPLKRYIVCKTRNRGELKTVDASRRTASGRLEIRQACAGRSSTVMAASKKEAVRLFKTRAPASFISAGSKLLPGRRR